jgi:GNAT superfamily N-acetyltransferase
VKKALIRRLLGDFAIWRIYRCVQRDALQHSGAARTDSLVEPATPEAIAGCADELLHAQGWYTGPDAHAFAYSIDGEMAALCFYWHGARYTLGDFWPLQADEAMLVQIVTTPARRGHGIATTLIDASGRTMLSSGFKALHARVWITNRASSSAFEAAGWREVAMVIELNPLRRPRSWCIRLPRFGALRMRSTGRSGLT